MVVGLCWGSSQLLVSSELACHATRDDALFRADAKGQESGSAEIHPPWPLRAGAQQFFRKTIHVCLLSLPSLGPTEWFITRQTGRPPPIRRLGSGGGTSFCAGRWYQSASTGRIVFFACGALSCKWTRIYAALETGIGPTRSGFPPLVINNNPKNTQTMNGTNKFSSSAAGYSET